MSVLFILFLGLLPTGFTTPNSECLLKEYGPGKKVCVCNSEHCDYFSPEIVQGKINIFTSTQAGARYSTKSQEFSSSANGNRVVEIKRSKKHQTIIGWGAAITDSVGVNLKSLPNATKEHLMRSYFSGAGSKYNLVRIPMGGTDFSTRGYSYDDGSVDENLQNFQLAPEDFEYKIPLMRTAQQYSDVELKFLTSTWTAPKWMKTNGEYCGGKLKEEYYQTWADYFLKFLKAYKEQGFKFWGITSGNEPFLADFSLIRINSVGWTHETASLWIRENLGPTLRNSEFADIKIMAIDDQRLLYLWYAPELMKNVTTRNYVDGFSVHWYTDKIIPAFVLSLIHYEFPDKFIISMEASNGFLPGTQHVIIGSWERGENYAQDIIDDLNNWVNAWVDWNLALDTKGGPTYIHNYIDSPILVNATAGEFYKQPMYYVISHFSKFIPEGSVRIGLSSNFKGDSMVAFERPAPDNDTVLVILNKNNTSDSISIQDGEKTFINLDLEPRSITTLVF